jgi:hypothetical protein
LSPVRTRGKMIEQKVYHMTFRNDTKETGEVARVLNLGVEGGVQRPVQTVVHTSTDRACLSAGTYAGSPTVPDFTMCRQNLPNYLASVHPNCSDLAKGRAVSSPPVQFPHKLWHEAVVAGP